MLHRPQEINDALDILSSCYHELDHTLSLIRPHRVTNAYGPAVRAWEFRHLPAMKYLDHAMNYLERTYTNVNTASHT